MKIRATFLTTFVVVRYWFVACFSSAIVCFSSTWRLKSPNKCHQTAYHKVTKHETTCTFSSKPGLQWRSVPDSGVASLGCVERRALCELVSLALDSVLDGLHQLLRRLRSVHWRHNSNSVSESVQIKLNQNTLKD